MSEPTKRFITGIFLAVFGYLVILKASNFTFAIVAFIGLIIAIKEFMQFFHHRFIAFCLALIYPTIPILLIIWLKFISSRLILYAFFIVSMHDLGSYIFGKLFGKDLICKTVSAGKTWQGFLGGILVTIFSNYLIFKESMVSICFLVSMSALISVTSLLGDMFESCLKRIASVKDSGNILPGHGGILDRLDAILFAVFVIFIYKDNLCFLLDIFCQNINCLC